MMKTVTKREIINGVKIIVLAFVLSLGVGQITAWVGPPGTPTNCPPGETGCDAPLHVGAIYQTKLGGVVLGDGLTTDQTALYVPFGKIGVATDAPSEKIDVVGRVKTSGGYCIGASCIDAWPSGGGGGGGVPSGAVMAFDLSSCPDGWSAFAPAAGRNVIGVNASYALGAVGGSPTVSIGIQQMPAHTHSFTSTGSYVFNGGWGSTQAGQGGNSANNNFQTNQASGVTSSTGSGQPFTIMDPYVALLYCVKN